MSATNSTGCLANTQKCARCFPYNNPQSVYDCQRRKAAGLPEQGVYRNHVLVSKLGCLRESFNSISLFASKRILLVFHLYVTRKNDTYEHTLDYFAEKS